jgi:ribosome maturation factor RimP
MAPPADPITVKLREEVGRLGFDLVDVRVAGPTGRRSLRLRIDRPGSRPGAGVTSADCTAVSRAILKWFPEAFPGQGLDALEVSSPGVERPLRWPEHWRRFVGERVRLRLRERPGRPVAVILDVPDDAHVLLEFDGPEARVVALDDVLEATLAVDWSTRR